MSTRTVSARLLLTSGLLSALVAGPTAHAAWGDHVDTAQTYIQQIQPANNRYDSPVTLGYSNGVLIAVTKCGSFVGRLLINSFSSVTTTVLKELTGSTSPTAEQWYDAIQGEESYDANPNDATPAFQLHRHATVADLEPGDILASKYDNGTGITGHAMVLEDLVTEAESGLTAPVFPHGGTVEAYLASIYDSTKTPHGTSDTRYNDEPNGADGNNHDEGIGNGELWIFEDVGTGLIAGWSWSSSSSSTVYQSTDPAGSSYRPIAAGALTGPGL